jgi:hypothetical protein
LFFEAGHSFIKDIGSPIFGWRISLEFIGNDLHSSDLTSKILLC